MLKKALIVIAVLFVAAQLVRPERGNPPVDTAKTLHATGRVTPDVAAILDRACRDCHSNETRWPWYSQVAPVSWLVARDVRVGRKELSFSTWGDYPVPKRLDKLDEMCKMVREGEMPQFPYPLMHPEARLSDADNETLCAWTSRERLALQESAAGGSR
jgi:hypothetical protein